MKPNRKKKKHLRLIKTLSSLSLGRSYSKESRVFQLRVPVFIPLSKYLAYSCSCGFTGVIYTICLHDHVSVNMYYLCLHMYYLCLYMSQYVLYMSVLRSAISALRNLNVLDILYTILRFSVFCSIGFLRLYWLVCFWSFFTHA